MVVLTCEIAFPVDVMQTFTYRVPGKFSGILQPGCRVIAPFGPRHQTGYCISVSETPTSSLPVKVKEISEIRDDIPLFTPAQLSFFQWMSTYYMAPPGLVFRAAHPSESGFKKEVRYFPTQDFKEDSDVLSLHISSDGLPESQIQKLSNSDYSLFKRLCKENKIYADNVFSVQRSTRTVQAVRLNDLFASGENEAQQRILAALKSQAIPEVPLADLVRQAGVSRSVCKTLEKKGVVSFFDLEIPSDPFSGAYEVKKRDISLTREQVDVINRIMNHFESFYPVLLYGVTGSGKTEIYIHLAREALNRGKQALILVPEIAITPHVAGRFRSVFGKKVAIWHSRMSASERIWTWQGIRRGDIRVVVGARSALFSPFSNPGLIVVDEEQDASYKQQEQSPGYHGRDAAVYYARLLNIPVILGSATPSVESWYLAQKGKYHLLNLSERFGRAGQPKITILDMRLKKPGESLFTHEMLESLRMCIKKDEQAIVLHNRRGFHTFARCEFCGQTVECPYCSVSMTWHKPYGKLICHYCDHKADVPSVCPSCGEKALRIAGSGTQRIEDELAKRIKEARIIRMDLDSTRGRHSHVKILNAFEKRSFDILLGTQMVSKGLDFSNVTLVCIVNADTGLGIPDFRSGERVWQLVSQVAGRSGRGILPGRVLIQSWQPEHPSVELAAKLDVQAFYKEELKRRRLLLYPPYSRLILIRVMGKNRERVVAAVKQIAYICREQMPENQVLGPSSAPVEKVKENFRWQILLKFKRDDDEMMHRVKHILVHAIRNRRNRITGLKILLNADPVSMN